jgi:hypothetical protein
MLYSEREWIKCVVDRLTDQTVSTQIGHLQDLYIDSRLKDNQLNIQIPFSILRRVDLLLKTCRMFQGLELNCKTKETI